MEQPFHSIRSQPRFTTQRAIGLAAAVALQAGFIYALVSGLAATLIQKLPDELKVAVEQQKLPDKIPPPPPPPLQQPPPPFVPPPDIVIQTEAPVTNAIVASTTKPPAGITAPASIGRAHSCMQNYPDISMRLQEEGTTGVSFHIDTEGNTKDVAMTSSSGHEHLDQAALSCVARWHYKPAVQNGVPVEVPWQANVKWQLK